MIAALVAAGALFLATPLADASPGPSPVPSPTAAETITGGSVSIFGDTFTIPAGERRQGSVSVYGGTVDVEGSISHDLRVYGGTATVNGTVGHDVKVLGGTVILGPHAVVEHDVTVVGGALDRDPGARIGHDLTEGAAFTPDLLPGLSSLPGLPRLPQLGGFDLQFGIGLSIGIVLLALLLQLFFPAHVARTRDALEERPFASLGFGCLTAVAGVLLALLLGITVLLLPVSLAIAAAMGLAWLLGLAAAIVLIGRRLTAALHVRAEPVPTLLLGGLLVAVLVNVPFLGGLFALVLGAMALGAVVLTRFGTRAHPPAPQPVVPPPTPGARVP